MPFTADRKRIEAEELRAQEKAIEENMRKQKEQGNYEPMVMSLAYDQVHLLAERLLQEKLRQLKAKSQANPPTPAKKAIEVPIPEKVPGTPGSSKKRGKS